MSRKILGIIPARYGAARFPGKPLAMIHGKPMIQRVYEQALKCSSLSSLIIATDDERILKAALSFGADAIMTSGNHHSGTERCAEAASGKDFEVVINIQGDEPFIHPDQIEQVCQCFMEKANDIATLVKKIITPDELLDENAVKVVRAENGEALYFSRTAIPYCRGLAKEQWLIKHIFYKHIGIYGYRTSVLEKIVNLPADDLERAESLEQLRWLAHGYRIYTAITLKETISIDTPEDLSRAEKYFTAK